MVPIQTVMSNGTRKMLFASIDPFGWRKMNVTLQNEEMNTSKVSNLANARVPACCTFYTLYSLSTKMGDILDSKRFVMYLFATHIDIYLTL